jgi:hypothetical protein
MAAREAHRNFYDASRITVLAIRKYQGNRIAMLHSLTVAYAITGSPIQ